MDLNPVVIHLEKATERIEFIQRMEVMLGTSIRIHKASDGSALMADPSFSKYHIHGQMQITQGAIGCYKSHVDVIDEFEQSGDSLRLILEDDTVFFCDLKTLRSLIAEADSTGAWDVLYFGYSSTTKQMTAVSPHLAKMKECIGAYAMLLKRSAIPHLKAAVTQATASGRFYPADLIYSLAMESGLVALGPKKKDAYCWYKSGMYSYVCEQVRVR